MLLIAAFALAFLAPPILCLLLYRLFRKKGWVKTAWIFPVLLLAYGYFWYDAFYPSDEFYEREFVEITDIVLPSSADIIRKSASYPDQHGDYSSCAAITVSRIDFDNLLQKTKADSSFSLMTNKSLFIGSNEFDTVARSVAPADYLCRFTGEKSAYAAKWGAYVFVAFLADHKTVLIYRASS